MSNKLTRNIAKVIAFPTTVSMRKDIFLTDCQPFRISCTSNGTTTLQCASGANFVLLDGMSVEGTNIAAGTKVTTAAPSTTTITLDTAASGSGTQMLTFLPASLVGKATWSKIIGNWSASLLEKPVGTAKGLWTDTVAYSGVIYGIPPMWLPEKGRYVVKNTGGIANRLGSGGAGDHRSLAHANWTKTNTSAALNAVGIDGASNTASTLTATAANGTALNTITGGAGTFSAFVKRSVGRGKVWITRDGGTTYKDITTQINSTDFTQVAIYSTATNPAVGFCLETNTDAIIVDCANDTNTTFVAPPFLGRPYDVPISTIKLDDLPATVQGYRYSLAAIMRTDGWATGVAPSVKLQNSAGTSSVNLFFADQYPLFGVSYQVSSGSTFYYNNAITSESSRTRSWLFNSPEWKYGEDVELELIWGLGQLLVLLNGKLIGAPQPDTVSPVDPAAMDEINITGDFLLSGIRISRLNSHNVVLVGDSQTDGRFNGTASLYSRYFQERFSPYEYSFINKGTSGNVITDVTARVTADITASYLTGGASNTVVLWIGTNSIAASVTAATCLTQMQTLIDAILAGHSDYRIVVVEVIDARSAGFSGGIVTNAATFLSVCTSFNAGLAALSGVDEVVRLNDIAETADSTDTLYFMDGIHMTRLGYAAVMPRILAALEHA